MKNFQNSIIILGIFAGVLLTTSDANANRNNRNTRTDKETKTVSILFNQEELIKLEKQLIEDYLKEIMELDIADSSMKIYHADGTLFFEGNESMLQQDLEGYIFLYKHNSVAYYLIDEIK